MQNDQKQKLIYILENTLLLATSIANFVQIVRSLIQELQILNCAPKAVENKICSCGQKSEILAPFLRVAKSEADFVKEIVTTMSTTANFTNNASGLQIEETHNEEIVNTNGVTRLEAVDVVEFITVQTTSDKEQLIKSNHDEEFKIANKMSEHEDTIRNLEETKQHKLEKESSNTAEICKKETNVEIVTNTPNNEENITETEQSTLENQSSDTANTCKKETNVEVITNTTSKNVIALEFVDFEASSSSPRTLKVISRVKFNSRIP